VGESSTHYSLTPNDDHCDPEFCNAVLAVSLLKSVVRFLWLAKRSESSTCSHLSRVLVEHRGWIPEEVFG
jgi:hypothetical protein